MVGGEYTLLVTVIDPFSLNAGPMTQKITLKAFTVKELKHQLQTKLLLSDGTKMMTSFFLQLQGSKRCTLTISSRTIFRLQT
jgi:hypothetical protein